MKRFEWRQRIQRLDPEQDYHEIYRITATHEFPWDMNQALSFALYPGFCTRGRMRVGRGGGRPVSGDCSCWV
jgi:hypothetical protein